METFITPYHRQSDHLQINRFLTPMKKYMHNPENNSSKEDSITYEKDYNVNSADKKSKIEKFEVTEYNNIKHLYGSEYELALLNAQKRKAINASQEFLLDRKNTEKHKAFIDAQYELRLGRGQYISKHIRSDVHHRPFGLTTRSSNELDLNNCHMVEFTCTEDERPTIPNPIMTKVATNGFNIFNLVTSVRSKQTQLKHIMEIINDSQSRISKQYSYSNSSDEVSLLEAIMKQIKKIVDETTQMDTQFRLSANGDLWDDTARHAKTEIPEAELKFLHNERTIEIKYRYGINIIVPTKVKVEHSVKTVHRFSLDFEKILSPMHIDLIVTMGNKEYVWTIHEFEPQKHQIFHTGYFSNDSRLFDMSDTIDNMTIKHQTELYNKPFYEKSLIELAFIDKNDDQSILNLHVYLAQSKFKEIYGSFYDGPPPGNDQSNSSHYTDVGYIYKYNQYTIVASGVRRTEYHITNQPRSDDPTLYSNFYTIIHWNNAPHSQNSTAAEDPRVIENAKINNEIKKVFDYMKDVSEQINKVVAHRSNPPEAALDLDNFFIPAIIEKIALDRNRSASGPRQYTHSEIGVYYLSDCTREERDLISKTKTQIMIKLLIEHFRFTESSDKKVIFAEVTSKLKSILHYDEQKLKECKHVPGYFGEFIKAMHVKECFFFAGKLSNYGPASDYPRTALEKWNDFWRDYLEVRPKLNEKKQWITEDCHTMKVMNAHLIDNSLKSYAKRHEGETRNTAIWHQPNHHQAGPSENVSDRNDATQPVQNGMAPGNSDAGTPTVSPGVVHQDTQAQDQSTANQYAFTPPPYHGIIIGPNNRHIPHMDSKKSRKQGDPRYHMRPGSVKWDAARQSDTRYHKRPASGKSWQPINLVNATDFVPSFYSQSKFQAEIDALKRTVNELTLRSAVHQADFKPP